MKNKDSYFRLLDLTAEKDWVKSPEIVKEVQAIGDTIRDNREKPGMYRKINGIQVTDQANNIKTYLTMQECIDKEKLSKVTISRHIKYNSQSKDGRRFSIF